MQEFTPMGYNDLGRCFHLGSHDPVWKVVEVYDTEAACQMIGTDDFVILPHEMVVPLLDEYDEYWSQIHCR